jgi:MoxR-like ATPase
MARFDGTESYVVTDDLRVAVNAALALGRPLLVKGEPGTGKTALAHEIAKALGKTLVTWHVKATSTVRQGLYEYDSTARLRDSRLGDPKARDVRNYIVPGKLWVAFGADEQPVLLVDEVDKAEGDFASELLLELDRRQFYIPELRKTVVASHRPIVVITSNGERELPDAFLRRCFFHYIRFPDRDTMRRVLTAHYPSLPEGLVREALNVFYEVREVPGLRKKPSTSELIDWIKLLIVAGVRPVALRTRDPGKLIPLLHGALLKNEQDVQLFERITFFNRSDRNAP